MVVSVAVFGPQSKLPTREYLDYIHSYITHHPLLRSIVSCFATLQDVCRILGQTNNDVANLCHTAQHPTLLTEWIENGFSQAVATSSSSAVALPRLVIIQIAQYFQYLERNHVTHADLLTQLRAGAGVHGYCGGLPVASAIACAENEDDLLQLCSTAIRLALAVGLYAELGDDPTDHGSTTMVVRLKDPNQAEKLVAMFAGTYISAITDPHSVSIVGPLNQLRKLQLEAQSWGLHAQTLPVRGKVHNPENNHLAIELSLLCTKHPLLMLPNAHHLRVPMRSNRTAAQLTHESLSDEIVRVVLASKCEWFRLMEGAAQELERTGRRAHNLIMFGLGDYVPMMPFHHQGLSVSKIDAHLVADSPSLSSLPLLPSSTLSCEQYEYTYPDHSIAIVGASCRLPGANNLSELWKLMIAGVDKHEPLPRHRFNLTESFRAQQTGTSIQQRSFYANLLDDVQRFDHEFFGINAREAAVMDPQQRILLELTYEALESSGYMKHEDCHREASVGCFIGGNFVDYLDNTNAHSPTAYSSTGTMRAFLCGRLSYHFGWDAPAEVIDTACSASHVAINRACKAIQGGECEMAVAGGVNIITGINNFLDLSRAGFLSPTGQCKPFDKDADGYCRAEGAGIIVLKPLARARLDCDHILAVIPAIATNQGGRSPGITVPDSSAQQKLYQRVLDQAAMLPGVVTYVEAHGTGTQVGDPIEMQSIRNVFGHYGRENLLSVGSIKGNIGHCEAASGVAGLLKVIAMLMHRQIPPQVNHHTMNTQIDDLKPNRIVVQTRSSEWIRPFLAALVNNYGAAGSNAALICCEAPCQLKRSTDREIEHDLTYPFVISAASRASLKAYAQVFTLHIKAVTPRPHLQDISSALYRRRKCHRYTTTVLARTISELLECLDGGKFVIRDKPEAFKSVVLVFGGQNTRSLNLNRSLYEQCAPFRKHLQICDKILRDIGCPAIFPAVFSSDPTTDIVVLQTGLVAIQYAIAMTWLDAGLRVDAAVGHSLGELTALAVCGMLSIRDCLELVSARARLMQQEWSIDTGRMLAIFATQHGVG